MIKYTALFCREDSAYKDRNGWDVYDAERDALTWSGGTPCVCHPPCRTWGVLSHMAFNARQGEKELALWSVDMVRANGGIIEHPSGSKLFKGPLPALNFFPDEWGGYTIEIDQFDFGHVAHKKTLLYICGVSINELPPLPQKRLEHASRSICGNVNGTKRCTQYQREYSPVHLIDWFESALSKISSGQA